MKVAYIETSSKDESPDLQRRDLVAAGHGRCFEERISSRKADRPKRGYVREGAALVAWKFDRFGRSLQELIERVNGLKERGTDFVSLREGINTATPGGKLVFHVFESVAEFERDLIQERTMAGLEAAWARGRNDGRRTG